jgi:hypothetical protein
MSGYPKSKIWISFREDIRISEIRRISVISDPYPISESESENSADIRKKLSSQIISLSGRSNARIISISFTPLQLIMSVPFCWRLFGAPNTQQEPWRCSLVRRGRSAAWGRMVRDLAQGLSPLPDGRTVRALGAGRSARTQRRRKSPAAAWISLPGGTPSGKRDPRWCLGSAGRPRLF